MRKILHISKYYSPFTGGTEAVCQDIAECLTKYENKVICFNHKRGFRIDYINNIEVIRINCFAKVSSQSLSFSYYTKLKDLIQSWKPDVIHFHHPNLFVAFFLNYIIPKDTKLIVHWHLDIVKQKFIYKFLKGVENKMLERADALIATSNNYMAYSKPLAHYKQKVKVVYNGINTHRLDKQPGDADRIVSIKEKYQQKKIIFFIGRHVTYKGLKYLLQAEKYVKEDCIVVIGGKGPLTQELKKQTHSQRVIFLGRLSENELRCYLHAADILAFPSITKNEAFGLALAEGMYCQCVPVTFTIPGSGVNEVSINGVTGIEVKNKDVRQYAQAIDTLLAYDELRISYSIAAKKRVAELFTVEQEQKSFRDLYKSLLD
jgi:glycosyltransferase involved in cell wall biosynthesis